MRGGEDPAATRAAARAYESRLPLDQRKRLGQFFTGMALGRLLAHLALEPGTRTVLDPMAGHGDLLDAVWEAASERGVELDRLDGIELDGATAAACAARLTALIGDGAPDQTIMHGSAFDPVCAGAFGRAGYDLVITNPPYVRYQSGGAAEKVRAGLGAIVTSRFSGGERELWTTLVDAYSGLADLSVPAWLLAAARVRPGGRLALVVPATWRSRDYADVIRYLMLRCFAIECVVEDRPPGWFATALVRTHLIVARRLMPEIATAPLRSRESWGSPRWLEIAENAADERSLVGAAFPGAESEAAFAAWVQQGCTETVPGVAAGKFDLAEECHALARRVGRRAWYRALENDGRGLPLFGSVEPRPNATLPNAIKELLPGAIDGGRLTTLEEAGIEVGQGLRTGCNRFFYVSVCTDTDAALVSVEASRFFAGRRFMAPRDALWPVLRRQAELKEWGARDELPSGRALVLRNWVLPEDFEIAAAAVAAYAAQGEPPPQVMPPELAAYVRLAATLSWDSGDGKSSRIPELSAVRTNIRPARNGAMPPRFWYMLPDFAPRHLPLAFVARVNHGLARVAGNIDPPLLIDANFSTFWARPGDWTRDSLCALLGSAWCRAFMEALGTPLGGGALKLEATHLRQMLVPRLDMQMRAALAAAGRRLAENDTAAQADIDELILRAVLSHAPHPQLASTITERARDLSRARQRAA